MRCQRIKANRLLAAFATVTVVAVFLAPVGLRAQTREDDSRSVYSAAFDVLFHDDNGASPGTIVLMDSAMPGMAYRGNLMAPHHSRIDRATIDDFEKETHPPRAITSSLFSYRIPIVLISLPELMRLDTVGSELSIDRGYGRVDRGTYIDAVSRKYPRAWGVTSVSMVGLNPQHTQALVGVRHGCGWSCFHREILFLVKIRHQWTVEERVPVEKSDGMAPGEVRYLGPDPVFRPRFLRIQDSTRKAIADSIARDALPRRLHGVALNRAADIPIPHAQVFLQHHLTVDDPEQARKWLTPLRTVADSLGRFEFLDPPIGTTTLILECPGPIFSVSTGLDMRTSQVAPGSDTEFNLVAPNIAPCWKSHRYFAIESGWLESAEARKAAAPTSEEASVMSAVIAHLRAKPGSPPIVAIQSRTITRCRANEFCGSIQFPRLAHDRVVSWSTIDDFKGKTSKSDVLNPGFGIRLGLHVVTEDEVKYLSSDIDRYPLPAAFNHASGFWGAFHQLHGARSAVISFTRAGFDKTHDEALIEVELDSAAAEWADHSRMMLLRRTGTRWNVENDDVGKGGTHAMSGKWEGASCVAVKSPGKASRHSVDGIVGLFDVTLVDAGQDRITKLRARIGRHLPPRWTPGPTSRYKPLPPLPRSYEVIDRRGNADIMATWNLSIGGIPRNIIHDPGLMRFDGFYQNLSISKVTATGFYGSFVDGVFGDTGFGFFCAQRSREVP